MAADTLAAVLTLVLLALVILLLSGPFRPGRKARRQQALAPQERSALEAEREAKYREIRDAELDFRTGKLSAEDHDLIVATLRAEAAETLKRLQRLDGDPERVQDPDDRRVGAADSARRRDEAADA